MTFFLPFLFFVSLYSILWFLIGLYLKRNDVADSAWGIGIVSVSSLSFFLASNIHSFLFFVLGIVFLWGMRLSFHILKRIQKTKEDERYFLLREKWKSFFLLKSFFVIFFLQTFLALIVAYPFLHFSFFSGREESILYPSFFPLFIFFGGILSLFGILFESIADRQLRVFLEKKKSGGNVENVMRKGLWKYTRHPNYFGEFLVWCGVALSFSFLPYGFFVWISPLFMFFILRFVSGVPLAEKQMKDNVFYEEYKKNTPPFFPSLKMIFLDVKYFFTQKEK